MFLGFIIVFCFVYVDCQCPSVCLPGTGCLYLTNSTCDACPVGKCKSDVSPCNTLANQCTNCGMGKYAAITGSTACVDCAPGTFVLPTGASVCPPCPKNFYCTGGAFRIPCTANSRNNVEGATNCSFCTANAGYYNVGCGVSHCRYDYNTYCPGDGKQYVCPENTSPDPTYSACWPQNGFFMNGTIVTACPQGFFCKDNRLDACPNNSYSALKISQMTDCVPNAGFYSSTYSCEMPFVTCVRIHLCEAGFFCEGGRTGLQRCAANTNSSSGARSAIQCYANPGYYGYSWLDISECSPGYYCVGGLSRQACSAGTFASEYKMASCLPCQEQRYQPYTGQSYCLNCTICLEITSQTCSSSHDSTCCSR